MVLFVNIGCYVKSYQNSIRILDKNLNWTHLQVKEKSGETHQTRERYFKTKREVCGYPSLPTLSKVVQINGKDIYLLGGDQDYPTLLTRKYQVPNSCFRIDLKAAEIIQKADMECGRQGFGVCVIGHRIFVVGGINTEFKPILVPEVYNTLTDKWSPLAKMQSFDMYGITLSVSSKRFIIGMGCSKKDDREK